MPWRPIPSERRPTLSSPQVVTRPPPQASRQSAESAPPSPAAAIQARGNASKPGGTDVEPALRMDAQLDPAQHTHIDRRPLRREGDLIEMAEPVPRDHDLGSSTSKSTAIPYREPT